LNGLYLRNRSMGGPYLGVDILHVRVVFLQGLPEKSFFSKAEESICRASLLRETSKSFDLLQVREENAMVPKAYGTMPTEGVKHGRNGLPG
jgi:hypothetical protein